MVILCIETLVECRAVSPAERLHFLGKYVSGEAKNVVSRFRLLDSEEAYNKAKEMLAKRFGENLKNGNQCEKAMEKVSRLNVFNNDQENFKMSTKLPRWVSNRWARLVYKLKE